MAQRCVLHCFVTRDARPHDFFIRLSAGHAHRSVTLAPHSQLTLQKETAMRLLIASIALALTTGAAHAADAGCEARATEKKLAGAAKNSFIKKCEKDAAKAAAGEACAAKAAEKKLAGAAKNSFVKKCEKDASAAG